MRGKRTKVKIGKILLEYVENNLKEYLIASLLFLLGIILGIVFINRAEENTKTEITNYICNFKELLQGENEIDKGELLKQSLQENLILGILLWFVGSTVIGIPIVCFFVAYRGFCIGYTISALIAILGSRSGTVFVLASMLLQNIIFIPALLAIAVSGMKLYRSILKDKRKENVKTEIFRHTIFSILITVIFMLSSWVEVYISTNLLQVFIKYL